MKVDNDVQRALLSPTAFEKRQRKKNTPCDTWSAKSLLSGSDSNLTKIPPREHCTEIVT